MSRIAVLSTEQILETAYTIVNTSGLENLTIRSIAKALNKSTAPIYTQYSSIDAIREALKIYVLDKLFRDTMTKRTEDHFLDIGFGILTFVAKNKLIFRDFFLTTNMYMESMKLREKEYLATMKRSVFFKMIDDHTTLEIFDAMCIFTYGLAAMICASEEEPDLSIYLKKLSEHGQIVMHFHAITSGHYKQIINNILYLADQPQTNEEKDNENAHA